MIKPVVSIIIPVYNAEKYILETLNSLQQQDFPDWEAICVDDGSTDNSTRIIQEQSKNDHRIILKKRMSEQRGGSVCRNIGINFAKGEFLIVLDSDDLLTPNCLIQRLHYIKNSKFDFACFPVATFIDGTQNYVKSDLINVTDYKYFFASSRAAWHTMSTIWRTSFLRNIGGFDESFPRLQDIETHFRAILNSDNYLVVKNVEADCLYRLFDQGYSVNKQELTVSAYSHFIKLLEQNINKGYLSDKSKFSRSMMLMYSNLRFIRYSLKNHGSSAMFANNLHSDCILNSIDSYSQYICKFLNSDFSNPLLIYMQIVCAKIANKYTIHFFLK